MANDRMKQRERALKLVALGAVRKRRRKASLLEVTDRVCTALQITIPPTVEALNKLAERIKACAAMCKNEATSTRRHERAQINN